MVNGEPQIASAIYPLISKNPSGLYDLYMTYPSCLYDTEGLETTINSLLFSATDIIGNVYQKISQVPINLDLIEIHYSCINKNYFSEDGILNVHLQKKAISIVTQEFIKFPNYPFVSLPLSDSTPPPPPPPTIAFFNPSTLPPARNQQVNEAMEVEELDGKIIGKVRKSRRNEVGKSRRNKKVGKVRRSGRNGKVGKSRRNKEVGKVGRSSRRRGSDHPVKK